MRVPLSTAEARTIVAGLRRAGVSYVLTGARVGGRSVLRHRIRVKKLEIDIDIVPARRSTLTGDHRSVFALAVLLASQRDGEVGTVEQKLLTALEAA